MRNFSSISKNLNSLMKNFLKMCFVVSMLLSNFCFYGSDVRTKSKYRHCLEVNLKGNKTAPKNQDQLYTIVGGIDCQDGDKNPDLDLRILRLPLRSGKRIYLHKKAYIGNLELLNDIRRNLRKIEYRRSRFNSSMNLQSGFSIFSSRRDWSTLPNGENIIIQATGNYRDIKGKKYLDLSKLIIFDLERNILWEYCLRKGEEKINKQSIQLFRIPI